jgi:hypothetical protein
VRTALHWGGGLKLLWLGQRGKPGRMQTGHLLNLSHMHKANEFTGYNEKKTQPPYSSYDLFIMYQLPVLFISVPSGS